MAKRESGSRTHFFWAVLGLAIFFGTSAYGLSTFTAAGAAVTHTLEVKRAVSDWLTCMLDAETGQRGYVISQAESFLEPYERSAREERHLAQRVRELTADNATQQASIDETEENAIRAIAFGREVVGLVRMGHHDQAVTMVSSGEGKRRVDAFRSGIARLQLEEDRLLAVRTGTERVRGALTVTAIVMSAIAAAWLAVLAWRLRREAESAAREANAVRAAVTAERAMVAERVRTATFQERFLAVLGHDLRNPLNSISMAHEYLELRGLPPDQARTLARATNASRRMRRMIEQLLDFTRARLGGGIPLTIGAMDLGRLADELADEARLASPGREIAVETTGDAGGRWDTDRLGQVVSNLVGNALTHGPPESDIRIAVVGERESVRLKVTNDGEILAEMREHLFDPFRRGAHETKSARAEGLGLGLFISQSIVHAHGGTIDASSSEGKTTLTIELPRRRFVHDEGMQESERHDNETHGTHH